MPGGWIAVLVLCLLLAASVYVVYEGWTAHSGGIEWPDWGTCAARRRRHLRIGDRLRADTAADAATTNAPRLGNRTSAMPMIGGEFVCCASPHRSFQRSGIEGV